jgi:antitoxin PrlF
MATATLTTKGQLVIPKPVRDHLHLHPGDTLDFLVQENGDVLIRPAVEDVRRLRGALHKAGRAPVPLAALREAVRRRGGRLP